MTAVSPAVSPAVSKALSPALSPALSIDQFAQDIGVSQECFVPAGLTVEEIAHRFHGRLDHLSAWIKAPPGYLQEWVELPRNMWGQMRPEDQRGAEVRLPVAG